MQALCLGKIVVATAGVPVPVTTDRSIFACKLLFSPVAGSGTMYVGVSGMSKTTGVGVITEILAEPTSGQCDRFALEVSTDIVGVSNYYVDAAVSGGAVYVTAFVE